MRKYTPKAAATLAACLINTTTPALGSHDAHNSCATPWANHGVSEATIAYGIDEVVPAGEIFLPMEEQRNTFQYRKKAFDFFVERFGVEFDVNDPGVQIAVDAYGRTAAMQPIKAGVGSTHQVYAIDAQNIPQWRHRMPMTSVALKDDGYFVFVGDEGFEVHGTYGGADGTTLPPGTIFLLGEYRMYDHQDKLMDTLRYFSSTPAFSLIDPGAELPTTQFTISCNVESDIFGSGLVRALGSMTTLPDGSSDLDFRYTLRFPERIGDADQRGAYCKPARALRRHSGD